MARIPQAAPETETSRGSSANVRRIMSMAGSGKRTRGFIHSAVSGKALGLAVALSLGVVAGCEKDTAPPPLPDPKPSAQDAANLQLEPEAEAPEEEASATAKGPKRHKPRGPSLAACCKALQQNSASAPPTVQGYYLQAAVACQAALQAGATSVVPSIKSALKNAKMPPGCL